METPASEVAEFVDGKITSGNPDVRISGFASLPDAVAGDLSVYYDRRYAPQLAKTGASAIVVPIGNADPVQEGTVCIEVLDPSRAFEKIVDRFGHQDEPFEPGIHPTAVVHESAILDAAKVSVGANAVIDAGAAIGEGTEIGAGCYIGRGVKVGSNSRFAANVTVNDRCLIGDSVVLHSGVVIGADGFGYSFEQGRHRKIPQRGLVRIDNDVEVGAGTTIDRARFGQTIIGEGTKIDNLVQIGHNVVIGKHCILVACVAIAGSARIGDYVVIAAQAGIGGHVNVGSRVTLGGRAGVTKDVPDGSTYLGFPACPANEEKRRMIAIRKLPELYEKVKAIEAKVGSTDNG